MTFTRLYLTTHGAPYTPATIRGTWNDTGGAVTRLLDSIKEGGGNITTVARSETSATNPHDVLLYRGVSGPLAAQTLSGTLDVLLGVIQNNVDADFAYKIHVYVTQGDSDTPRGTLLSNYAETTANEWGVGASTSGKALAAAQTLSSLAISDGDRLVVEIGYRASNTVTTSYTGTLWYGTQVSGSVVNDLTASGDGQILAGFLSFSNAITELNSQIAVRVSQVVGEGLYSTTPAVRVSQVVAESAYSTALPVRVSQVVVEVLRGIGLAVEGGAALTLALTSNSGGSRQAGGQSNRPLSLTLGASSLGGTSPLPSSSRNLSALSGMSGMEGKA